MQPTSSPESIVQLPALPPRAEEGNKGNFGRVLVVAGSRGMAGAAALCGMAALRGGAGLVRVAVPQEVLPTVAGYNPCLMTTALPQDDQGRLATAGEGELLHLAEASSVLAVGPGLGGGESLPALVSALLGWCRTPVVLDADGLNALEGTTDRLRHREGPLVLTPHPGEFARLAKLDIATVQAGRQDLAVRFAAEYGLVLVLKGHATVVTDGRRVYLNATGNPGMATAGSGDVLCGLVAALLGQGLDAFAAAQLGVYLHGLAGDLAAAELGEVSLIASDLLDYLPRAFTFHQSRSAAEG